MPALAVAEETVAPDFEIEAPTKHVMAQFAGVVRWACPECGYLNRDQLNYGERRIQCGRASCRRAYMFGIVIYSAPKGSRLRYRVPPDCVFGGRLPRRDATVNLVLPMLPAATQDAAQAGATP